MLSFRVDYLEAYFFRVTDALGMKSALFLVILDGDYLLFMFLFSQDNATKEAQNGYYTTKYDSEYDYWYKPSQVLLLFYPDNLGNLTTKKANTVSLVD